MCAHTAAAQRAEVKAWRLNGETRRAIVYSPSAKSASGRAPLVFSFHGHGDNMQNFQHTDLHRAWPEAIVVYFQGLPSRRDGLSGWQVEKGQDDDRDLALVDAALASLREEFKVDEARIYATGFSNGANFTYLLWAERPGGIRRVCASRGAAAAVCATEAAQAALSHRRHRGCADPVCRPAGRHRNGQASEWCDGERGSLRERLHVVRLAEWAPVMTWIHPGGHEYPETTSERIAKFFREHPK